MKKKWQATDMADSRKITYKRGYKYQLQQDTKITTGIEVATRIDRYWYKLDFRGTLAITKGYAWDGPSGPTFDTRNFMRGSLAHDVFYQMMRQGDFPLHRKDETDRLLQRLCVQDGMTKVRAWWVYQGVACFGKPGEPKALLVAP